MADVIIKSIGLTRKVRNVGGVTLSFDENGECNLTKVGHHGLVGMIQRHLPVAVISRKRPASSLGAVVLSPSLPLGDVGPGVEVLSDSASAVDSVIPSVGSGSGGDALGVFDADLPGDETEEGRLLENAYGAHSLEVDDTLSGDGDSPVSSEEPEESGSDSGSGGGGKKGGSGSGGSSGSGGGTERSEERSEEGSSVSGDDSSPEEASSKSLAPTEPVTESKPKKAAVRKGAKKAVLKKVAVKVKPKKKSKKVVPKKGSKSGANSKKGAMSIKPGDML